MLEKKSFPCFIRDIIRYACKEIILNWTQSFILHINLSQILLIKHITVTSAEYSITPGHPNVAEGPQDPFVLVDCPLHLLPQMTGIYCRNLTAFASVSAFPLENLYFYCLVMLFYFWLFNLFNEFVLVSVFNAYFICLLLFTVFYVLVLSTPFSFILSSAFFWH